jgi:hypothetical protein
MKFSLVAISVELENIMLSKMRKAEKDIYSMFFYSMWKLQKFCSQKSRVD